VVLLDSFIIVSSDSVSSDNIISLCKSSSFSSGHHLQINASNKFNHFYYPYFFIQASILKILLLSVVYYQQTLFSSNKESLFNYLATLKGTTSIYPN